MSDFFEIKPNYEAIVFDFVKSKPIESQPLFLALLSIYNDDKQFVDISYSLNHDNDKQTDFIDKIKRDTEIDNEDIIEHIFRYRYQVRQYINANTYLIEKFSDSLSDIEQFNKDSWHYIGECFLLNLSARFIEWVIEKKIFHNLYSNHE